MAARPVDARRKDARHAAAWLLAACGFLAAGVAGGAALTAWRPDIAWAAPLAGFFAYLLTFRRGMNLWYPERRPGLAPFSGGHAVRPRPQGSGGPGRDDPAVLPGSGSAGNVANRLEGRPMMDAVFLLLTLALFYAAIRYAKWSDRV